MNEKLIMNLQLFGEGEGDFSDFFEESDYPGTESYEEVEETDIPTDETTDEFDDVEEVQEELEEGQAPTTGDEPFLTVKYNKEDRPLSMEEAIELSQKGMNYDKVLERLNQAENNPALAYLNEIAERNGTNLDGLIGYWKQQEEEAAINQLIQQNIPEEYAREIHENKKFREQILEKEAKAQAEAKQKEEFDRFLKAFPNVDPKGIPASVWQEVESGEQLDAAYMRYAYQNVVNENKVLKQQVSNKKIPTANTSMYGSRENVIKDDFLEGFDSI